MLNKLWARFTGKSNGKALELALAREESLRAQQKNLCAKLDEQYHLVASLKQELIGKEQELIKLRGALQKVKVKRDHYRSTLTNLQQRQIRKQK